ncbi:MAG: M23 family metallopeptidase [Nesterenkonia sp.]|uniref:M23 family metallopeptidase n=1 Tax=Nesterenkonia marinintestina TaxID=2979865 RepID=UPI0021BE92A3|nr:M23 family metallopeptidase [Nesterenkonia sp. GX14115]MDO5493950.1 M23 family metallopeptidase [Nesterenkonia sp.]
MTTSPPAPPPETRPRLVYTDLHSPLAGTPGGIRAALRNLGRSAAGFAAAVSVVFAATASEPPAAVAGAAASSDLRNLEGSWSSPTSSGAPEVARPFVEPPSPWGAGHRGVDLAAAPGSEITAPTEGAVSYVGTVVDRPVLSVDHGSGFVSSFEPVESELEVGDRVSAGDVLGELVAGGHCADRGTECVHWGVRLHGEYINPLLMLGELEPSVLLPVRG